MRLHVLSDIHVDHMVNRRRLPDVVREMRENPVDVFVLAGDVSHRLDQVDESLRLLADLARLRLFVAGNHDVWLVKPKPGDPADSWRKLDLLSDLCAAHGYVPLERTNASKDGFTFVGSMGWYDYSYASPRLDVPASEYATKKWQDLSYMDGAYARWGMSDADVVDRLLGDLRRRFASSDGKVAFVSHHVPLEQLVLRRGVASWDFFNAYMGSRKIEALLRERRVSRFVFGHTHRPVTLLEPDRFVINNPVGYPRQAINPVRRGFDVS